MRNDKKTAERDIHLWDFFFFFSLIICFYIQRATLVDLSTVAASLGKSGLAAGGLAEHNIAGSAQDDGLGVAKYGGDLEASGALDVHEEAIGSLHKSLELVCAGLGLRGGVEQIDRHFYLMRGGVGF